MKNTKIYQKLEKRKKVTNTWFFPWTPLFGHYLGGGFYPYDF